MDFQSRNVKIHRKEMESLFNLKSKLEIEEALSDYVAQYQKLGWVLKAQNLQDGTEFDVDAGLYPEAWVNRGCQAGLPGPGNNLGVLTGKGSRLMVLEVAKGEGEAILDQYGPWRAGCIAVLGGTRERHFFAWQPSPPFDAASLGGATEFRWYGEGQMILVPPSVETESQESWEWLCPPWETPPQYPGPAVADFLQHHLPRELLPRPEVSLSWQEVYCLVSPFDPLRQALGASHPSTRTYYQGILAAAAAVGLNSPEVLLSLLWHAPGGDARQDPEGLGYLEKLVAEAQIRPNPAPYPNTVLHQLVQEKSRLQTRASSLRNTGPARFLRGGRSHLPQPRVGVRAPFSSRRRRED